MQSASKPRILTTHLCIASLVCVVSSIWYAPSEAKGLDASVEDLNRKIIELRGEENELAAAKSLRDRMTSFQRAEKIDAQILKREADIELKKEAMERLSGQIAQERAATAAASTAADDTVRIIQYKKGDWVVSRSGVYGQVDSVDRGLVKFQTLGGDLAESRNVIPLIGSEISTESGYVGKVTSVINNSVRIMTADGEKYTTTLDRIYPSLRTPAENGPKVGQQVRYARGEDRLATGTITKLFQNGITGEMRYGIAGAARALNAKMVLKFLSFVPWLAIVGEAFNISSAHAAGLGDPYLRDAKSFAQFFDLPEKQQQDLLKITPNLAKAIANMLKQARDLVGGSPMNLTCTSSKLEFQLKSANLMERSNRTVTIKRNDSGHPEKITFVEPNPDGETIIVYEINPRGEYTRVIPEFKSLDRVRNGPRQVPRDWPETLPQSYSDYEKLMQRPSIIPTGLGKTMIASGMMRDYMQIVDGDLERACPGISRNPSPAPSLHQATGAETPGAG